MPTPKKAAEVQEITELLKDSPLAILTDYRGLSVADLQNLRRQLRQHQANIRVVKNTLTAIAAEQAGVSSIQPLLEGPTALVTTAEDVVSPSKVVNDFVRTSRILQIKGALLEGQLIPAAEIENLASLPPREVLLARVVGGLQSPMYGLVGVLAGTIRQLGYVLNARAEQLGGGERQAA
jgi:large subunit ribosomal protein L10